MKNKYKYTNERIFEPSSWTVTFNCQKCGKQDTRKEIETTRLCHKCGAYYEDKYSVIK